MTYKITQGLGRHPKFFCKPMLFVKLQEGFSEAQTVVDTLMHDTLDCVDTVQIVSDESLSMEAGQLINTLLQKGFKVVVEVSGTKPLPQVPTNHPNLFLIVTPEGLEVDNFYHAVINAVWRYYIGENTKLLKDGLPKLARSTNSNHSVLVVPENHITETQLKRNYQACYTVAINKGYTFVDESARIYV